MTEDLEAGDRSRTAYESCTREKLILVEAGPGSCDTEVCESERTARVSSAVTQCKSGGAAIGDSVIADLANEDPLVGDPVAETLADEVPTNIDQNPHSGASPTEDLNPVLADQPFEDLDTAFEAPPSVNPVLEDTASLQHRSACLCFPDFRPAVLLAVFLCLLSLATDLTRYWIPRELTQLIGMPIIEGLMLYWVFCIYKLHRVMKDVHGSGYQQNSVKSAVLCALASPLAFMVLPELPVQILQLFKISTGIIESVFAGSFMLGLSTSFILPYFFYRGLTRAFAQYTLPGSKIRAKQNLYSALMVLGLSGPLWLCLLNALPGLRIGFDFVFLTAAGLTAAFWSLQQICVRLQGTVYFADLGFRLEFGRPAFRSALTALLIFCAGSLVWMSLITKPAAQAEQLTLVADFAGLVINKDAKLRLCEKAVSLAPDEGFTYMARAECYYYMGNFEKAISDFSTAIRLKHATARAFKMRGDSYAKIGEAANSSRDYKMALAMERINSNRD